MSSISRPHIYLLIVTLFLLIFVFVFSFELLIPKGKEYRILSADMKKEIRKFRQYKDYSDTKLGIVQELQQKNRVIIEAFNYNFNPEKFQKQYKEYFSKLQISPKTELKNEKEFKVYEVNATSQINSPKSFYNFLDAVNKGDWIISVNFPIKFKRKEDGISSSFTMKVYKIDKKLALHGIKNNLLNN